MLSSHSTPTERVLAGNVLGAPGLGALGSRPSSGSELFEIEVERVIAREGGREAVDRKRSSHFQNRRSARRGEFDRYHEGSRSSAAGAPRDESLSAERVPVDPTPPQPPVEPRGRAASDNAPGEAVQARPAAHDGSSTSGDRSPNQARPELSDSAGLGASGSAVGGAVGAQPGSPAPSQGVLGIRAATAARPSGSPGEGFQAFLGTERSKGGATVARAPRGAGHTPDPELIDQAAKVLRQIRLNLRPGARQVTLNLDPVELGRLSIDLRVGAGRVSAVVRAESPETLELLRKQAPELRAVLAQQGFETDQLDLRLGFENGNARGRWEERRTAPERRPFSSTTREASPVGESRPNPNTVRLDASGVDTFA